MTITEERRERMRADATRLWSFAQPKPVMTPEWFDRTWAILAATGDSFTRDDWLTACHMAKDGAAA